MVATQIHNKLQHFHSGGDDFVDTELSFPPEDLAACGVPPFAGASTYAVGYGYLAAVGPDGRQLAWWEKGAWHA